jgi:UDP-glucose 4-epimerase
VKKLILGGAGFLGSHLCDVLLRAGSVVRVFDRPGVHPYRIFHPSEQVEWQPGDFNSAADIELAVKGCNIIYHLISTTLPKTSNDDPIYDVESNVIGTLRLLEAARRAGVKKVVFVSSGGTVYGVPKQVPIPEDHPTNPYIFIWYRQTYNRELLKTLP